MAGLYIKDKVEAETKRLIKIRAAERGVSMGEALNELVKLGAEQLKGGQHGA